MRSIAAELGAGGRGLKATQRRTDENQSENNALLDQRQRAGMHEAVDSCVTLQPNESIRKALLPRKRNLEKEFSNAVLAVQHNGMLQIHRDVAQSDSSIESRLTSSTNELTFDERLLERREAFHTQMVSAPVRCATSNKWLFMIAVRQHGQLVHTIVRRYSELRDMHHHLLRSGPWSQRDLPKFPPRRWYLRQDEQFAARRKSELELYLREILSGEFQSHAVVRNTLELRVE